MRADRDREGNKKRGVRGLLKMVKEGEGAQREGRLAGESSTRRNRENKRTFSPSPLSSHRRPLRTSITPEGDPMEMYPCLSG